MKKFIHKAYFYLSDFLSAFLAWIVFYFIRKHILGEMPESLSIKLFAHAFLIGLFWVILYGFWGAYQDIYKKSRIKEFLKDFLIALLGSVIIFFVLLLDDEGVVSYKSYYQTFGAYFLIQFIFSVIFKLCLLSYIKLLVRTKKIKFNTIIIGSGLNAKEIFDAVEKNHEMLGFTFVGYLHLKKGKDELHTYLSHLGGVDNIKQVLQKGDIEHVVIAAEQSEHDQIHSVVEELENFDVKVSIIPDIYELLLGAVKINHVFSVPLVEITLDLIPEWQKTLKRSLDVLVAIHVLFLGAPFLFLIALITKLTSKGPVFYFQERVGQGGVPFRIIKFRSMKVDAENNGPALSSSSDPRATKWGRFMRRTKLDEFPQFYNVLIGDMSIVGPRPERQYFIEQIIKVAPHYKYLQRVKPGITSLGQVKFGYAENIDQMVKRLKYDIIYIENMSLSMDFQIIFYTFLIMISGRSK